MVGGAANRTEALLLHSWNHLSRPLPSTFLVLIMNTTSLLLHSTDLPALSLPATHPSFDSSLLSFAPLLPSSLSLPAVFFFIFSLSSLPLPQHKYHLTLMKVLIIYTEDEGLRYSGRKEEHSSCKYTRIQPHPVYDCLSQDSPYK